MIIQRVKRLGAKLYDPLTFFCLRGGPDPDPLLTLLIKDFSLFANCIRADAGKNHSIIASVLPKAAGAVRL